MTLDEFRQLRIGDKVRNAKYVDGGQEVEIVELSGPELDETVGNETYGEWSASISYVGKGYSGSGPYHEFDFIARIDDKPLPLPG